MLTTGFASIERRATSGNLMFGSSLLAAAIPLIALLIPDSAANNNNNNRRSTIKNMLTNAADSSLGIQGRVDYVMGLIERSIEHLPNFPRLHPQECVKRSICEAHNDPARYGAIGLTLRLLFPVPPPTDTDPNANSNELYEPATNYKPINKYKHAARLGLTRRLESNGTSSSVCKDKYEDCLSSRVPGSALIRIYCTDNINRFQRLLNDAR